MQVQIQHTAGTATAHFSISFSTLQLQLGYTAAAISYCSYSFIEVTCCTCTAPILLWVILRSGVTFIAESTRPLIPPETYSKLHCNTDYCNIDHWYTYFCNTITIPNSFYCNAIVTVQNPSDRTRYLLCQNAIPTITIPNFVIPSIVMLL